jgi:protein-S-isoprenylcysteine O-methyltransferase Ste14
MIAGIALLVLVVALSVGGMMMQTTIGTGARWERMPEWVVPLAIVLVFLGFSAAIFLSNDLSYFP